MTGKATDTDVIIIGAGAAGLNAAKTVRARGLSFVLLEASHRIGGRAYSEQFADGSWFDLGCSYLHEGEINPMVAVAQECRFALGDGARFDRARWHFHQNAADLSPDIVSGFWDYYDNCDNAMANLPPGQDSSVADIMDWDSRCVPAYSQLMAGLNASDVTDQSVRDYLASGFGLDIPVHDGLGHLVARWGADVPVRLNTAVTCIEWRDGHVIVDTSVGRLTGKTVIVTVSTGILASGQIRFDPPLPPSWQDAIHQMPCGTLNKIGLAFAPNSFDRDAAGWHVNWMADNAVGNNSDDENNGTDAVATFDINLDGKEQAVVFAGGSLGIYLEKQGPAAMRDYALSAVTRVFGAALAGRLIGAITTAWTTEPMTLGAYSHVLPGHADARARLGVPLADTVFFAGEATSTGHCATCHGAFLSGARAANAVADILLPGH